MTNLRYAAAPLMAAVSLATLAHAAPQAGAQVSAAKPATQVDFEVFLPLRDKAGLERLADGAADRRRGQLPPVDHAGAVRGPVRPHDGQRLQGQRGPHRGGASHRRNPLALAARNRNRRSGSRIFGTTLNVVTRADGHSHLEAANHIVLPDTLQQEHVVVAAFNRIPEKHTFSTKVAGPITDNRYSNVGGYYYNDMKQAYNYPSYATILRTRSGWTAPASRSRS